MTCEVYVYEPSALKCPGKWSRRPSVALRSRKGLFFFVSVPHSTLQAMYSRHFSFLSRGMRLKILPFKSQESISEA